MSKGVHVLEQRYVRRHGGAAWRGLRRRAAALAALDHALRQIRSS